MSALATLTGVLASSVVLRLPPTGPCVAEVELTSPVTLAGAVQLVLGDLTYACTVVRGGPVEGSSSYLVVGGAGGWSGDAPGKPLPAKSYRNDLGVKLSTIVADLARDAGERAVVLVDRSVGAAFVRPSGAGRDVLARLSPWWVEPAGVTNVGQRPATVITAKPRLLGWNRKAGVKRFAADTLAPFVPGAILDGAAILEVVIRASRASTRLEVRQ